MMHIPLAWLLPFVLAPAAPAQEPPTTAEEAQAADGTDASDGEEDGSTMPMPPGMPTELDTRGVIVNAEGALPGYVLFATLTQDEPGGKLHLIDANGESAHSWTVHDPTEAALLLEDGDVLRWAATLEENERFQGPGVDGGVIERLDWEGNVLWRFLLDDDYQLMHHDVALLPNGNVMFLVWEHRFEEDAIAWGRDPSQVGASGMWPDAVYEIRPTPPEGGEIVWEWHVWDHIVQDFDATKANYGSVADEPGKIDINADHRGKPALTDEEIAELEELEAEMAALGYGGEADEEDDPEPRRTGTAPDWMHTNAIDYDAEHDLIVLSSPTLNEIFVIDHSTTTEEAAGDSGGRYGKGGELLWRWGNPRNYGAGADADQRLSFQHDPTWLEPERPGELRLLVFNNGRVQHGSEESFSSIDELVLPFDPERGFSRAKGEPYGPEEPVWRYSDPGNFYSSFISSAQRLPNGNTLICSGAQGRIFEVTRDGEIVWDYRNPMVGSSEIGIPANSIYRALKVPADHPGLANLTR